MKILGMPIEGMDCFGNSLVKTKDRKPNDWAKARVCLKVYVKQRLYRDESVLLLWQADWCLTVAHPTVIPLVSLRFTPKPPARKCSHICAWCARAQILNCLKVEKWRTQCGGNSMTGIWNESTITSAYSIPVSAEQIGSCRVVDEKGVVLEMDQTSQWVKLAASLSD